MDWKRLGGSWWSSLRGKGAVPEQAVDDDDTDPMPATYPLKQEDCYGKQQKTVDELLAMLEF